MKFSFAQFKLCLLTVHTTCMPAHVSLACWVVIREYMGDKYERMKYPSFIAECIDKGCSPDEAANLNSVLSRYADNINELQMSDANQTLKNANLKAD